MRPVWMLSATQALCMSGSFLFFLLGGIIGSHLTPTPALATLPVSVMIAGLAASVVPAGLLIHRFGRRAVFVGSALQAAGGCILAGYAISTQRFWLFCAAAFLLGSNNAVVMQYRFAATEYVEAGHASRAIAVVMCGALAAAWLGPELAVRTADLVPSARHAGSFYSATALYLVAAVLLSRISAVAPAGAADLAPPRPLREIAAQPVFQVAVLAALASYTVMSFIMTATPISMHIVDGHDEVATARVIQVHLLGMYLPSLGSGWIIARFGDRPVIVAGTLLMTVCVAVAVYAGHGVAHYGWALGVLGLGWNLLFIAATTLLTKTYTRGERVQAQTLNDFLVFGAQATASLLAGVAVTTIGWERLNLATLPLLAAVLLATLAISRRPIAATG
ncbi:MAG TPA: MFS transporter [Steroidobacteraceae bacterium]|nr:MFS transporter [Steroidobacteraceae bacterium]